MVPNVLLLSCYELGRQPLGLAVPIAFFERAAIAARGIDLAVEPLDEDAVRDADFIGVSVPMHTALRIGLGLIERLRGTNPSAHLCFYGLYATLNAELLRSAGADSVLGSECEDEMVAGVVGKDVPSRGHRAYPVPRRDDLPSLERYAHLDGGRRPHVTVGSVESTRGCLHLCRHCPIPPVYDGRFFVVPVETVLEDVRQLVSRGAGHIDFADADFLNGPGHALRIARAMHREFPEVTFNFTAKVEHLLKYGRLLGELAELGCLFIVSAVESLSDRVLAELDKGHCREDVFAALDLVREAGIALRPTFVPFTPWTTGEDYRDLFRWIAGEELVGNVEPIQLTLRLLVPPGSLLLKNRGIQPYLGALDAEKLTYSWRHPDPGMDELSHLAKTRVERGVGQGRAPAELFSELAELSGLVMRAPSGGKPVPGLTEAWFC